MKFHIYHPVDDSVNSLLSVGAEMEFKHIVTIDVESFGDAFEWCQNFNEHYAKLGVRSTSIGDVIVSANGGARMPNGIGWKNVEPIFTRLKF